MKITEERILSMLKKAEDANACDEALDEIKELLETGGVKAVLESENAPEWAVWYAEVVMQRRWSAAEAIILTCAYAAYEYAKIVLQRRWPEAEAIILTNHYLAYAYAFRVLKARWPEAEDVINSDPQSAHMYAKNVLHIF